MKGAAPDWELCAPTDDMMSARESLNQAASSPRPDEGELRIQDVTPCTNSRSGRELAGACEERSVPRRGSVMVRGIAERAIRQEFTTTALGATDEELLAQFLDTDGVASEDAFHTLVGRHGPRVLRICRHVLDREHDAEDAFQATFLTLARKGASIRNRRVLAGWLHEVAHRVALRARSRAGRRRLIERQVMTMAAPRDESDNQNERVSWEELRPVLHEEVVRLPEK